jgi:excisionase family DNA binding protein
MAQFYTLEEAARVLGMSPEELKAKAQQREIRAFLDGGSWRFRVVDVDELARRRGLGSDAELRLSDLDDASSGAHTALEDLDLSEFQLGVAKPELGAETVDLSTMPEEQGEETIAAEESSDHDILLDDLSLPPSPVTGSSSVIIGMQTTGKLPSDSDVRLMPDNVKGASDSDVRLASPDPDFHHPSDSDVTLIKDDTADHGVFTPSSSSDTSVRPSPMLGSSAEVPASQSDSDFELNPSSVIDALQPDSGSDFELSALDASDEFESTPMSKPSDSDVTAADPNLSGINLSRPSDSGINLQAASGLGLGQSDSIELAPLSDDEIKAQAAQTARPSTPRPDLSATPPPARAEADKDIFDDTDFEVDVALTDDGSSEDNTVQLTAAGSDFEIEESDSGSEVFAIDEEDVDQNAATAMGPAVFAQEEEEEDDGFNEAVSSEMATAWSSESETPSGGQRSTPMMIQRDATPEWGGVWVGLLGVTTVFMLFLAFISLDLVRNLYDFSQDSPASGLVRTISGLFFQ